MRVIAGTARGRKIQAPPGSATRPIGDRVKESVFNMLTVLAPIEGTRVLDLYAGSGSFGIECLSRGAETVIFVEQSRTAAEVLAANLERLGFADRARIEVAPVESLLGELPPADLAFCDPPYALDMWSDVLPAIDAAVVVGHAEHDIEVPPGWRVLRRRTYGRSRIVIAAPPASSEAGRAGE